VGSGGRAVVRGHVIDLDDAFQLLLLSDDWIQLALERKLHQIHAILTECVIRCFSIS
jgi:hypothetical protein